MECVIENRDQSLKEETVGSLISPLIGKWKTGFLFVICGILAEIACSFTISYAEPVFGGGSSGGIFANDNMDSFLMHAFGFVAGILVCLIMVLTGWINDGGQSLKMHASCVKTV